MGGSATHERLMLRNLASQLFEHGRITTTETKARRVQPLAEKLITKAKRGDLHARRTVLASITDTEVVTRLFDEIAPAVADREGGYTRITKIGPRKGDNAPLAVIELITESVEDSRATKAKAAKGKPAAAKPEAKADEEAEVEQVEVELPADDEAEAAADATAEASADESVEEAAEESEESEDKK